MTAPERVDPPMIAGERAMLAAWLDYHRETLALKCSGLTAVQLAERAVPPSSLSLLGLLRHMADVERSWFRRTLAGEDAPGIYFSDASPDGDFDDLDSAPPDEVLATWRRECAAARTAEQQAASLDATGNRHGQDVSLRWIMVHMIEEYARHNGHADLLRERIDGTTGD
jgi:uncharacterized damage-inducible protein DinB